MMDTVEGVHNFVMNWFNSRPTEFYDQGICKLVPQLQKCFDHTGDENNIVARHKIPGLYTAPSAASALEWYAVLFIRSGPYEGGIFRFTLFIPETFPDSNTPRVIFQSDTFHPQIDKDSGELNIREKFPEWRKDLNHLWQVLDYTQAIFYNIETKNAINLESTNLFETDLETWKLRVSACVGVSKTKIFDPPPVEDSSCLKFSPYNEELHGSTKEIISAGLEPRESCVRPAHKISWVQPGSLQPLSRPNS